MNVRRYYTVRGLAVAGFGVNSSREKSRIQVLVCVFWLSFEVEAESADAIHGTDGDDFILVGAADALVTPAGGDDFLIDGPGNNSYVVRAGDGDDTLYAVEGKNYIEFDSSITFSDVANGLMKSGDDLKLNIGQAGQSFTIKEFFAVAGTVEELRFANGGSIPGYLIYQVFGVNAPTEKKNSKIPYIGEEQTSVLAGTADDDILIPIDDTNVLRGVEGDDLLVGRASGVTFEIGRSNGEDFIVAYEGDNVVLFVDGITFNDVASNLMKVGDDLILSNGDPASEVRVYRFFTHANTISSIRFESGGEILTSQLISLFGVPEPTEAPSYQMIVDGVPLGNGTGVNEGGNDNPSAGECDPSVQTCDGSGTGSDDPTDPATEWPELLVLVGTETDDVLVASSRATFIRGGAGDDFIFGAAGNDRYRFEVGDGHDIIRDVAGDNVVEFGTGISFSDATSGLMRAGDDLILNIGQLDQSITVKDFFKLTTTVERFEFANT